MPRKIRIPVDVAQNREAQRLSRGRHREYVASLEAQVREFKERGHQATLEMQRAARDVAWTNEKLVELLELKGISRGEVDEFLLNQRQGVGRMGESITSLGSGLSHGLDMEVHGQNTVTLIREKGCGEKDGTASDERAMEVVCEPPPDRGEGSQALVTSCDDAATIIAGFRGHGDVSQARQSLGCGNRRNCHVKNTRLFQLLDEAG
ncbi:hypothetical protein GGR57DRAFT_497174 [Xylariaceae sp. FL1272]|nr:hypothetical protein GGR57DRAFT_497174 [Xylariaceae sp. FL1272]